MYVWLCTCTTCTNLQNDNLIWFASEWSKQLYRIYSLTKYYLLNAII